MSFMQKMKNTKGGFTLIEILVVIGIIAILATIVLVAINPARQFSQAHNTQRVSNVNAVLNAIGQYIADNKGLLPPGLASTTVATEIKTGGGAADLCALLVPTYLPALPVDPNNGSSVSNCGSGYATGYLVMASSTGRVTVSAPSAELGATISVTR